MGALKSDSLDGDGFLSGEGNVTKPVGGGDAKRREGGATDCRRLIGDFRQRLALFVQRVI